MRKTIFTFVLVILASVVFAEVPQLINYQGLLTNDQGDAVTSPVSMTFTIYNAVTNGNSKWTETHPSVSVVNGLFNVVLGAGTPPVPIEDTVFSGANRWLEIVVGGETITPRTKLASNPYAFQSNWTRIGDVLYTVGEWGIARAGNVLFGSSANATHVNLGVNSVTGDSDPGVEQNCTVSGGSSNTASGYASTVSGGTGNTASGQESTVGGGSNNTASGFKSTVCGGSSNSANGDYSFAAGSYANADHDRTFVWSGGSGVFTSTADNQFLIRAEGGVGIGTNSPSEQLDVVGNAIVSGNMRVGTHIKIGGDPNFYIKKFDATSTLINFDANDFYRFNQTSNQHEIVVGGVARFFVTGSGACYNGTMGACSDRRFKKDVASISNAVDKISRLQGITHRWRIDEFPTKGFAEGEQLGFIAQDVQEIFPSLVSKDGDGYVYVDYAKVTPLLVEAVKEQQKQIEDKQSQIDAQQAQIDELKKLVQQLADKSKLSNSSYGMK